MRGGLRRLDVRFPDGLDTRKRQERTPSSTWIPPFASIPGPL